MTDAATVQVSQPSEREVRIERHVAAPRETVFRAFTDPDWIPRWLAGPPGWRMVSCEVDLREGGKYRYAWHGPDGEEMTLSGRYLEIDAPSREVHTESFEPGWTGGETEVTTLLREERGGTLVELTILFPSSEARDSALETGMVDGMAASYDRLDDVLT